jgi:hypothetical protein
MGLRAGGVCVALSVDVALELGPVGYVHIASICAIIVEP